MVGYFLNAKNKSKMKIKIPLMLIMLLASSTYSAAQNTKSETDHIDIKKIEDNKETKKVLHEQTQ